MVPRSLPMTVYKANIKQARVLYRALTFGNTSFYAVALAKCESAATVQSRLG
jgi:hypothetical protein